MNLAKIKEYKLSQSGLRGAIVSLPKIFITDNNLEPGDILEFYRGQVGDYKDVLLLIPKNKKTQYNFSDGKLAETV